MLAELGVWLVQKTHHLSTLLVLHYHRKKIYHGSYHDKNSCRKVGYEYQRNGIFGIIFSTT
jgi:hypothetical protein